MDCIGQIFQIFRTGFIMAPLILSEFRPHTNGVEIITGHGGNFIYGCCYIIAFAIILTIARTT